MDVQSALDNALVAQAEQEEWEDGDEEYDEEEGYDAEAEEIAKRLGDQLWADIAKAQAEASAAVVPAGPASQPPPPTQEAELPVDSQARKQEAALVTVRTILSFAYKDPIVRATLATQVLTTGENTSVLDILTRCATSNSIAKDLAKPLSDAVVSLAKSDVLFSSMRNSDAAAIQLDKGKRKRDQADDDPGDDRFAKRTAIEFPDILAQITQAVSTVSAAFSSQPSTNGPPDPQLIAPIHFPLHQVYLFAVTSAPRARPEQSNALQELGALIQMLGVLSKVHIGPAPAPWGAPAPAAAPDIGTAVYPCLVPGCSKTFHRLYSLRTHQRLHALMDRPYRCPSCPASFQRNHDLKRHAKLHDKTAYKCCGCGKIFSRRDAIKRHKDNRGRGGKGHVDAACAAAEIEEVEVEKEDGEEDATRRAKLWSGIVANQLASANGMPPGAHMDMGEPTSGVEDDRVEEGEVAPYVVERAQVTALQLYPIIKSRVAPTDPSAAFPPAPPAGPHPTLASVMARSHPSYQSPPSAPATDALANEFNEIAQGTSADTTASAASVSLSWLSEEQTKFLEEAIAQAAAAAQAQAEAEAALEEEEEDLEGEDDSMETT
ncbi:hypothetical protein PHLGIDRAFT_30451 [Phlebiopsis gigantea 11061_1 CR5-6]|uniref:C2H2-type domain-containing protein n=1 Tax=Phlebiopsis gigantea (strain 11061_1 CR5-6) TaxID=745531 RepID=A0A0C3RXE7_PHLG1|nr:hypothetical protein PHLGIDRAFT_30451 [Phlebiopsis gigantea 11061_1 CR5-6]